MWWATRPALLHDSPHVTAIRPLDSASALASAFHHPFSLPVGVHRCLREDGLREHEHNEAQEETEIDDDLARDRGMTPEQDLAGLVTSLQGIVFLSGANTRTA
ncbi:hypothetical protein EI94DRAFT_1702237 [Lactarius quietus]|nr:hypothetical protein EI94DRAFT_1702237 [Lactarius quietus]